MSVLRTIWLWIVTAFRANPFLTVVMCVTTMLGAVLGPASVYGVKLLVDGATGDGGMLAGILFTGGALFFATVASKFAGPIGDTLDEQVFRFVHDDLLRLTAEIPSIAHHEHPELADRVALVERDAHQLGGIYRLLGTLGVISGTATVVVMLWSVSPLITPLLLLALVPGLIAARGLHQRNQLWRTNERFRRVGLKVLDVLLGPRQGVEVRCFGLGRALLDVVGRSLDARRIPWVSVTRRFALLEGIGWLLFGAAYACAVLWVFHLARLGQATLGDLALVLLIGPQISTTAHGVASNLATIVGAVQTFGRYHWLRDYAAENTWAGSVAIPPERLRRGITFSGVDFAYPSTEAPTLHGVDLELPAGRTVAFVGENGAGKSTLVKLLARLYDPTAGAVLIDGVPLADLDPAAWRSRISAGFQDFATLEFTASDSIGVGSLAERSDRGRVQEAVEAGQAAPVVERLESGLDTQLGRQFSGGVDLSGGQWQRLALARAFMRTEPLLMLLDEPTAALDPEAEFAIYDRYARAARELGERTGAVTVLVSHRFSTVRMADLIVVVANGGISEVGSHQELITAGGRYAELFEMQARAYR